MSKKRCVCVIMSILTVFSLLTPNTGFVKAKKMALSKTKLTMKVGESKTLKVKNTKKKVKWSSSKKSVATVSKKGKIKAKKAGKATITAKVGKKKLKCKITVKANSKKTSSNTSQNTNANSSSQNTTTVKKIDISSFKILNSTTIEVVLSQEQQLPLSAFSVMAKRYSAGQYNKKYEVETLTTSDNRVYTINIADGENFENGNTIKVVVYGLLGSSGEVSKEAVYNGVSSEDRTSDTTYMYQVGEKVERSLYLSDGCGYIKLNSVEVPDGVTYQYYKEDDENCIGFAGAPTKAGVYNKKITYSDELGNQYIHTIHWIIGSNDTIAAYMNDSYTCYTKNTSYIIYDSVYVIGGSGEYTYEIANNSSEGAFISQDYYSDEAGATTYIGFENKTAGDKNVYIKVTDIKDSSKSVVVKWNIHVKNTVSVSGRLVDATGQEVQKQMEIRFVNKDDSKYMSNVYGTHTESGKRYSVNVVEGTYDVYIYTDDYLNVKVATNYIVKADVNKDFVLKNYYPVEITYTSDLSNAYWYDEWGDCLGQGNLLYLKKGTYNLTSSTKRTNLVFETISVTVTVVNSKVTVQAMSKTTNMEKGSIMLDEALPITLNYVNSYFYDYYKFVPTTSNIYSFYSTGSCDTYGSLLDENYSQITTDDDGGEDGNFKIEYQCEAGKTYYIGIRSYSSGGNGGEASLIVTANSNLDN